MTVYVLLRESQNEHGFVETDISGVFRDRRVAEQREALESAEAQAAGHRLETDSSPDGEWDVSLRIEEHVVDPA